MKCISLGCSNDGTFHLEGEAVCPACAEVAQRLADIFVELDASQPRTPILLPSVNSSDAEFTVEYSLLGRPLGIRYGLGGLKGVGKSCAEGIAQERKARGPFRSLEDFAARVDASLLNKRELEALAKAGAFDCLEPNRAMVLGNVDRILAYAKTRKRDAESGNLEQNFGG
jgi:DNA polymerase-3 subunit alpha